MPMDYVVYIIRTKKGTLYTGQTNNLEKRLKEHANGGARGARYTKAFGFSHLEYKENYPTLGEALKREHQIKQMDKQAKELLIQTHKDANPRH